MPMSVEARKAASVRMKAMIARKKAEQEAEIRSEAPQATAASTAAGINIPPSTESVKRATIIPQLPREQLEAELDDMELDDWLEKHHNKMDANYDILAKVSHLGTAQDVRDRLKVLGYAFPDGA